MLVELNFDRSRPPALINLNEVAELRGFTRENGTFVLGAGLTYTEAMRGEVAEALPALAEASRTVGSPQIRNRGTIGGNLGTASPAGDALPPLLVEDAQIEVASVRGRAPHSARRVPRRRQEERARARRAGRRGARRAHPRGADVHEGRPAERDGDLGLLARAPGRPRAGRDPRRLRLGLPDRQARHRSSRSGRRFPGARRARARARSTTFAAPRPIAGTRSRSSLDALSTGAWHEDLPDRQRRAAGGRRLGWREPPLHAPRAARPARARRTPASRASAARAPSSSTARSSAPASSSRRRPTATRS